MANLFTGGGGGGGGGGRNLFSGRSSSSSTRARSNAERAAERIGRMTRRDQADFIRHLREQHKERKNKGGKSLPGWLGNLAEGALSVVTGMPATAELVVKAPIYGVAAAVEAATGGRMDPKWLGRNQGSTGRRIVSGIRQGLESEYRAVANAIAEDYKHRWGPLLEGDFKTLWDRFYDDPFPYLVDVGGGYSATGAATRNAARAASRVAQATGGGTGKFSQALAKIGEKSILPAGEAVEGGRVSTGSRYREPKRYQRREGENSPYATAPLEVSRRPYSRNPITRGVQKQVEKATGSFARFLERRAETSDLPVVRYFGADAKYDRKAHRAGADLTYEAQLRKAREGGMIVRDLPKLARKAAQRPFRPKKLVGDTTVALHLMDLLDVPGKTRKQAFDDVVSHFEREIAAAKSRGERTNNREKQLQALRKVREADLDLTTAHPAVVQAVERARTVSKEATALREKAGTIREGMVEDVAPRAAQIIHQGLRWDPKLRTLTPELQEAAIRLHEARKARDSARRPPRREQYVNIGRRIGRVERNLELTTRKNAPVPRDIGLPNFADRIPGRKKGGRIDHAEKEARLYSRRLYVPFKNPRKPDKTDPASPPKLTKQDRRMIPHPPEAPHTQAHGPNARRADLYYQQLQHRAAQFYLRQRETVYKNVQREANEARKELARAEKHAKGAWTVPGPDIEPAGQNAVYFPHQPADPVNAKSNRVKANPLGSFTNKTVFASRGQLLASGNISMDMGHLIRALDQALVDNLHPEVVRTIVDNFAVRHEGGKGPVVTSDRAIALMRSNPDEFVLVSRGTIEDAIRKNREANPDDPNALENPTAGIEFMEGQPGVEAAQQLPDELRKDVIAVPKSVVEGWRRGYSQGSMGKWGQMLYDTPLQLWRRGILALAPRWYLNNLFGNTLQYGLLTGFDIKSILQARRESSRQNRMEAGKRTLPGARLGDDVPDRVAGGSLIQGSMVDDVSRPRTAFRRWFERVTDKGMDINQKMEGVIRRAAWISRAKAALRNEGVKVRKMSPEELVQAFEKMPDELKDQVLREVELGMGDYVRMSRFERDVLKRLFPFYSWMRVIGRLMGSLPIQHPKRTAILSTLNEAAGEALHPTDFMVDVYNRGRVLLPGGLAWRTMGANPFTTHAELAANIADQDLTGVIGSLSRDMTPIGGQPLVQLLTGRNQFGRPFTSPPGEAGTSQSFGGRPYAVSRTTGLPEERIIAPSFGELVLQQIPIVPQLVRGMVAGGQTPYDTASTWDLILNRLGWGKSDAELYRQPSEYDRPTEPLVPTVGGVPIPLNPVLALLGFNVHRRNEQAEIATYLDMIERQAAREEATLKERLKLGIGAP